MNGSSSLRVRSTFAKNSGEPSAASPWPAPQGSASQKSWTRALLFDFAHLAGPMVADARAIVSRDDRVAATGRRGLVAARPHHRYRGRPPGPHCASPVPLAGGRGCASRHCVRARARSAAPSASTRRGAPRTRRSRRCRPWRTSRRALATLDRTTLLERADAILAHRFDLLGSGPVDLGRIDWLADFKAGRRLAARAHLAGADRVRRRVRHQGAVGADALPAPAAAWRPRTALTGEARYLDEIGAQIEA